MYKKQFKMQGKYGSEMEIYAENFMNAAEVIRVCSNRSLSRHLGGAYDYFVDRKAPYDSRWSGFKSQEDLFRMASLGITDAQMVNSVQKYAHKATVEEKDKYTTTILDVAGGGVNVPLLLSGSPMCMYSRKKAPVKSKIINMGIHCEVTCEISQEKYAHAGMLIAQTISKLEKAGYRMRINTMDAFYSSGCKRINVLTTVVKKENEPMNYARILYPLTNVSYSRGIGFAWCTRNPDFNKSDLGTYAEYAFDSENRSEMMDEMFEKATGLKGFTSFKIKDLINMIAQKGDDATLKYMEARLMASVQ